MINPNHLGESIHERFVESGMAKDDGRVNVHLI